MKISLNVDSRARKRLLKFGDFFPFSGGTLTSDLPEIKAQYALIIKQLMLCNLVLLLGSSATGTSQYA